jgi:beta-glucanase (GH16 family)
MTQFINFLLLATVFLACKKTATPTITNPCIVGSVDTCNVVKSPQLIWSDEFNKEGALDTTKWRFESGFARNEEAQWYQAENAVCSNGNLVITAKKERRANPTYVAGSTDWRTSRAFIDYTSASVVMKKEHAFKYGKMEIRAKIVAETGLWPAIWTLGVSGEWPSNGEVDVMEYYNNQILANFAIGSATQWQAIWDSYKKPMSAFPANWADSYHVWTLEWTADKMEILLDGVSMNTIDVTKSINKSDNKNPFQQPHYLLLNLALGGQNGGSLTNTAFPSQYLVDYVRIYAPK